jgi:hypothetical protein
MSPPAHALPGSLVRCSTPGYDATRTLRKLRTPPDDNHLSKIGTFADVTLPIPADATDDENRRQELMARQPSVFATLLAMPISRRTSRPIERRDVPTLR